MDADSLFEKASAAAERGNYDYAIAIYREILANDPDYNRARIALRGCERRRFDEAGSAVKGTLLGYLKGVGPLVKMLFKKGKADAVIECCEDFLLNCPRSAWALGREADAARKAGRIDLAIYLYEDIRQLKSGHVHALQSLGQLYEEKNDVRKAQVYYQEMLRNMPGDTGIEKKIRDLQAVGHMQDTKMEEAESFQEMIRDKAKAAELEKSTRIVRSDEEVDAVMAKLQADVKQDPANANLVVKLGDLYLHRKRYEDALKAYKRAHELAPTSFAIRQKIGDLQFKRIELFIDQLEQKAARNPNDEGLKRQLSEALQKQKKFAVQEYGERVAQHPTDLGLHLKLGLVLMDNDEVDKAITEFQQSVADPKIRVPSRNLLGQCFARKKQYDLAIRQFQMALEGTQSITDATKPIHYELAAAYAGQGNKQAALDTFKKIYEVDINFRDVSAKIAELDEEKGS